MDGRCILHWYLKKNQLHLLIVIAKEHLLNLWEADMTYTYFSSSFSRTYMMSNCCLLLWLFVTSMPGKNESIPETLCLSHRLPDYWNKATQEIEMSQESHARKRKRLDQEEVGFVSLKEMYELSDRLVENTGFQWALPRLRPLS